MSGKRRPFVAAREGAFFVAKNPADPNLAADVEAVVLAEATPLPTAAAVGNGVISGSPTLLGPLIEKVGVMPPIKPRRDMGSTFREYPWRLLSTRGRRRPWDSLW